MMVLLTCPGCYTLVEVIPDVEGQVTCPACKGYYPLSFAIGLDNFEKLRKIDKKGKRR
jgi:uncharacterized protein YbaR (Trm112 family)